MDKTNHTLWSVTINALAEEHGLKSYIEGSPRESNNEAAAIADQRNIKHNKNAS